MDAPRQYISNVRFSFTSAAQQPSCSYCCNVGDDVQQELVSYAMVACGEVRVQEALDEHEFRSNALGITTLFLSASNRGLFEAWKRHCRTVRNRQLAI